MSLSSDIINNGLTRFKDRDLYVELSMTVSLTHNSKAMAIPTYKMWKIEGVKYKIFYKDILYRIEQWSR